MFQGAAPLSLDAKGRLVVPAKHREGLQAAGEGRFVLTAHPDGCLTLYPQPTWLPIRAQIMSASNLNPQAAFIQRLIVGQADDVEIDGAGRVLVPPSLRDFAALEKDIFFVGQGNKFEVWSDTRWRAQQAKASLFGSLPLPPGLENLVL